MPLQLTRICSQIKFCHLIWKVRGHSSVPPAYCARSQYRPEDKYIVSVNVLASCYLESGDSFLEEAVVQLEEIVPLQKELPRGVGTFTGALHEKYQALLLACFQHYHLLFSKEIRGFKTSAWKAPEVNVLVLEAL